MVVEILTDHSTAVDNYYYFAGDVASLASGVSKTDNLKNLWTPAYYIDSASKVGINSGERFDSNNYAGEGTAKSVFAIDIDLKAFAGAVPSPGVVARDVGDKASKWAGLRI